MIPTANSQTNASTERVRLTEEPGAAQPQQPPAGRFDYGPARNVPVIPKGLGLWALALGVALAALFGWTLGRFWERWHNPSGYYSHGPLVLPIAVATAWLIIRRRGLPVESTPRSRLAGMSLLAVSLLAHIACMYARITFISGFAFLGAITGIVLYLGGRPMLSRLWFPIVFLAFMVPLPDVTIGDINFRLKLIAAGLASWVVNAMGVVAILNGSDIILEGGKRLTVEDACSGLRSLISLLAFATLFTYACKLRGYKRALLFVSAVPIAIIANVVRIAVLTTAAAWWDPSVAMPGSWLHDSMGFLVFVVAFCLMFFEEELLEMLPGAQSGAWLTSVKKAPIAAEGGAA